MDIVLFKDVTTSEVLADLLTESEEYTGLYVDMNNAKERKYVKDKAQLIVDTKKKLERARIDLPADYKAKVQKEFKKIDEALDLANLPFTLLIDEYKVERAKVLEAEKKAKEVIIRAEELSRDHEFAILLNDKMISEAKQQAELAEQQRIQQEEFDKQQEVVRQQQETMRLQQEEMDRKQAEINRLEKEEFEKALAESKEKQRIIDDAAAEKQRLIDEAAQAEREKQAAIEREEYAKQQAEIAAENAKQAEIQRQQYAKEQEEAEAAKRESNKRHRAKVSNAIVDVLTANGLSVDDAKTVVKLAAKKELPQLVINY